MVSGKISLAPDEADYLALYYGGIAQLGERLNGIQEVSGSIPLISTTGNRKKLVLMKVKTSLFYCLEVGQNMDSMNFDYYYSDERKACYVLHILPWPDPGFQLGEA